MIPTIGLIIACYTVVRFVQIAVTPSENAFVKVLSGLACVATLILSAALLMTGSHAPYSP